MPDEQLYPDVQEELDRIFEETVEEYEYEPEETYLDLIELLH